MKIYFYLCALLLGLSGCQSCEERCADERQKFIGAWTWGENIQSTGVPVICDSPYDISIVPDQDDACIMYIQNFMGFGDDYVLTAKFKSRNQDQAVFEIDDNNYTGSFDCGQNYSRINVTNATVTWELQGNFTVTFNGMVNMGSSGENVVIRFDR